MKNNHGNARPDVSLRRDPLYSLFPFRLNRNGVISCFDAFSSREPVSTSLENALE
jgi:hypothetical protein